MRLLAIVLLLVATAAACGSDDEPAATGTTSSPSAGAVLPGGGLSVEEAMQTSAEPPLAVKGWIVRANGDARLCSSLLESSPPQCGEPSLRVEGEVDGETGDQVTVFGAVENGTLVVDSTVVG